MEEIQLKIYNPENVVKEASVYRVVIPAFSGNLTIIKDRAPTSVLLNNGVVQILGTDNKVLEKFFIKGGVADIVSNVCTILTEKCLLYKEISKEEIKNKIENAKTSEEYKKFYQMILSELELEKA